MPKRVVLGRECLVESGVTAFMCNVPRSSGLSGKKWVRLWVGQGVDHMFTKEVCGSHVGGVRTEWFLGNTAGVAGGTVDVSSLPSSVIQRYRLEAADHVSVMVESPERPRVVPWPEQVW